MIYHCANCKTEMTKLQSPYGIFWGCESCLGRSVGVGLLRKVSDPQTISQIWVKAKERNRISIKECPCCVKPMLAISFQDPSNPIELDVCPTCYLIWFDNEEIQRLPRASHEEITKREKAMEPKPFKESVLSTMPEPRISLAFLPSFSFVMSRW